jgi:squalene-associated FAD-dependent desaturase
MSVTARVVVIGAGFAGLSCAAALAGRGARVTVLEARRAGGGRAGSFVDEHTGDMVDNGQHLFMACYRETRRFLVVLGTEKLVRFQENLTVTYLDGAKRTLLKCPPLPAPWHLLSGMLTLKGPGLSDRIALLAAAPALRRLRREGAAAALEGITVTQWLDTLRQTENLRRWLWHPLAIATLNESPDRAPASLLARVLLEGFLQDRRASGLGVATVGLDSLYVEPACRYIAEHGGEVRTGVTVARLRLAGDRVEAAETKDGESIGADQFVSCVPPQALARMGVAMPQLDRFESSPILSVNLWLDRPLSEVADFDFAGLVGRPVHWLFNKERILGGRATHLSAVISAARDLVGLDNDQISAMVWREVQECLPAARDARLTRSLVVRERTATFAATVETEPLRPGPRSPYANFLLAGDWTQRGMPATIETAVRSGHRCAEIILSA